MAVIWSYVQINEQTLVIEQLEKQIKTLKSEEKDLKLELELKDNLKDIETYAKEKLGMVQIDQLAKKYISVNTEEKIELEETGKSGKSFLSMFRDILKEISNALGS